MTYIPKSELFRVRRFVSNSPTREMREVKIPVVNLRLEKGSFLVKEDHELTKAELSRFSKSEVKEFLIKKEDGSKN